MISRYRILVDGIGYNFKVFFNIYWKFSTLTGSPALENIDS